MRRQQRSSPLRIFFSYSPGVRRLATLLASGLANRPDVTVFSTQDLGEDLVEENFRSSFRNRIKEEIRAAGAFVVLLSGASAESPRVLQELGGAWALEKPLVAVLVDPGARGKIPFDPYQLEDIELENQENQENPGEPGTVDRIMERLNPEP